MTFLKLVHLRDQVSILVLTSVFCTRFPFLLPANLGFLFLRSSGCQGRSTLSTFGENSGGSKLESSYKSMSTELGLLQTLSHLMSVINLMGLSSQGAKLRRNTRRERGKMHFWPRCKSQVATGVPCL